MNHFKDFEEAFMLSQKFLIKIIPLVDETQICTFIDLITNIILNWKMKALQTNIANEWLLRIIIYSILNLSNDPCNLYISDVYLGFTSKNCQKVMQEIKMRRIFYWNPTPGPQFGSLILPYLLNFNWWLSIWITQTETKV